MPDYQSSYIDQSAQKLLAANIPKKLAMTTY